VKVREEARNLSASKFTPARTVEIVCRKCGFDLSEKKAKSRKKNRKCPSCRKKLKIKQSVVIEVATLPSVFSTVQT
jgi:predicted Zn-ribbon and HTH transcriptional regulator